MGAAIPLVLGGASIYQGAQQNEMANRRADEAGKKQDELVKRQTELFDTIRGIVTAADKGGQFDPTQQLLQLDKDINKSSRQEGESLASAMRVAGYKPGDSEIGARQDAVTLKHRDARLSAANNIRQNSFLQKLQAYQAIGGQQLNPGIGVYGMQQQNAMSQRPDMGGLLGSMQPYLMPQTQEIQQQQQAPFRLPRIPGIR
jgi:hypothetical protein